MATDIPTDSSHVVREPGVLAAEYHPSVEHLVTEDDTPVDNIFSEKQQRLLTEPLYSSWNTSEPFLALANVGLFHSIRVPPYVPDALLSTGVRAPENPFPKSNRSYFVWEYGKVPDVVIEVVSNREGHEDVEKLSGYARIGIPFYVIYDPELWLRDEPLRFYKLTGGQYQKLEGTIHMMPTIGLGITTWRGSFEGLSETWLRWTDLNGVPIPTGAERASALQTLADAEQLRADAEKQRADAEQQRADVEKQRADAEHRRNQLLLDQMKRLGISPETE
ncbi:MAG: Uma2 family endonuclease [Pirellula sp.]